MATSAAASETGVFWGRIINKSGNAVPGAAVELKLSSGDRAFTTGTDAAGNFSLVGLPPGVYEARIAAGGYTPAVLPNIRIEPGGEANLTIRIEPFGLKTDARSVEKRESAFPTARTVIPRVQMDRLPTAHSVWSLVENQDFSATTNRIDVGGLWSTVPALFSARGATSWTQNAYLLDGLDVTDPYWTGTPLFLPDIFSLEMTSLGNAVHPIQAVQPGAVFDLIPREGTSEYHGGISGFYLDKSLTTSNLTPALAAEGLTESNSLNRLMDLNVQLSGPLGGSRRRFFTSWTSQSVGRNLADYAPEDESRLASGLFHITRDGTKGRTRILWTGQIVAHPTSGAGRMIPPETTFDERNLHNVLQWTWQSNPRPQSSFRLSFGAARADLKKASQTGGPDGPSGVDILQDIPATTAPYASNEARTRLSAAFDAQSLLRTGSLRHRLQYGLQLRYSFASSNLSIKEGIHLRYFEGVPAEAVVFASPFSHTESSAEVGFYAQETIVLPGGLSLSLGGHALGTAGWNPADRLGWFHLSPRLSAVLPLSRRRSSSLRVSAARYYWTLPLNYLAWGNPDAPGGLAYRWEDENGDGRFQTGERGVLLRREGPLFGSIDPEIRRPSTDEFAIALVQDFGRGWLFSIAGFLRENRNLIETVNVGAPASAYDPVSLSDFGDDRIPGSFDDLTFTVFARKPETFGLDFFLLTNPDRGRRASTYKGIDLVVLKTPTERSLFFLALTATEAWQTTSPGNTEWENDEGVLGALYDDPNAGINARGRPRFDRAYTGRLGAAFSLPFGFSAGAVIKYYDGRPFARKIVVPGLPQGPFYIMAHPRGIARFEFNMTADIRLEKRFRIGKKGALRVMADVFNLFNQHLATEEQAWTGPAFPLRFATEIESPRVARLGLNYSF